MIEEFGPRGNGYSGTPPENWRILPMRDVCSKVTDGTHDTPQVLDAGVPFITAIHVKNGKIDFANCSYLSAEDHADIFKRCNPERGDLTVVNIGAGVAECGAVDVDFEFSMKNVALLKPRADILDHQYLLQSHLHRKDRIAHAIKSGGAQPFMSLTEIRKLPIAVPPIPEQRRIAEILSTWDRAIEATEKLIANSEAQKKALMQQLLTGKKRLPGFHGEWSTQRLDSLAIIKMGSSPKSETYNENGDGLPLLQGNADIKNGRSFPRLFTNDPTQMCSIGDILLSVRAPVGSIAVSDHEACIGRGLAAITPRSKSTYNFLLEFLNQQEPKWQSLSQGSTFEAVNSKDVKSLLVPAPPSAKEFEALGKLFATSSKQLSSLNKLLERWNREKAALMQQLLTGKRRVAINKEEAVV